MKNNGGVSAQQGPPIDFDEAFKRHLVTWFEKNQHRYADMDAMEADMPEEYLRWLAKPSAEFGGAAPGTYFNGMDTPALVSEMLRYTSAHIPLPDTLLERIVDLGDPAPLYAVMQEQNEELRILGINLLEEMGAEHPVDQYIDWILSMHPDDAVADAAAEKLYEANGQDVMARLIQALEKAPTPYSQDCLLDILTHYPVDEAVFSRIMRVFDTRRDKAALYASFLGRYGEERAIPTLVAALDWREINYLDYLEIRNAVESLGGTVRHRREFSGDPFYETLKTLEDTED